MSPVCSLEACPADTRSALAVWVSDLTLKAPAAVLHLIHQPRRYDPASCLVQEL